MEIQLDLDAACSVCYHDVTGNLFAHDAVPNKPSASRRGLCGVHLVPIYSICPVLCCFIHEAQKEQEKVCIKKKNDETMDISLVEKLLFLHSAADYIERASILAVF